MVRYLFYTIGDLTYQSPLVDVSSIICVVTAKWPVTGWRCCCRWLGCEHSDIPYEKWRHYKYAKRQEMSLLKLN